MLRRSYVVVICVAAAVAWYLNAQFGGERALIDPITVEAGTIAVKNQTGRDWRNVIVTVNDHFHGGAPTLAAGGRLSAPVGQFATAHGQRFDRGRQSVYKVEVKATDAAGEPVRLEWIAPSTKGRGTS
jgi:hypothetical protein